MNENEQRTSTPASVMVIDDQPRNLRLIERLLGGRGYKVLPFTSGAAALRALGKVHPQLIVLDIKMPGMDGWTVRERLAGNPETVDIPVIFLSGIADVEAKAKAFAVGGVDYIIKPFQPEEVIARLETHLRIRRLQQQLADHNRSLEQTVREQVAAISDAQRATITALARLAESRDDETGQHIMRVQRYCEILARQLQQVGHEPDLIGPGFIEDIFHASALHDIGKVAIPDAILLKPGGLTTAEVDQMRQHTTHGSETLQRVLRDYPDNRLLEMGEAIARCHHERWDGGGYPLGLRGAAIPMAARIMSVADVYDALRSRRLYKQPLEHAATVAMIAQGAGTQFDPDVVAALMDVQDAIEQAFDQGIA
jgi:putative two-component system response regulator